MGGGSGRRRCCGELQLHAAKRSRPLCCISGAATRVLAAGAASRGRGDGLARPKM